MKIPNVTIQQLLEAGVHLGHKTLRWNPKMKKYIFGKRDSIHIIDLTQTLELTKVALEKVYETIANNGKILFVSTKKQASEAIAELAKETDQYFVNYRWLGGMLTNWGTISNSIKKLKKLEIDLTSENRGFTKKELLKMSVKKDKLQRSLGGISEMKINSYLLKELSKSDHLLSGIHCISFFTYWDLMVFPGWRANLNSGEKISLRIYKHKNLVIIVWLIQMESEDWFPTLEIIILMCLLGYVTELEEVWNKRSSTTPLKP